ncbi:13236_t:CDS:2, partial [Funneliformis mosseae]
MILIHKGGNNWIGRVGGKIGLLEVISFENQTDYVGGKHSVFFFGNLVYRENVDRKIAISLVDLAGLKNRDALHQGISSSGLGSVMAE